MCEVILFKPIAKKLMILKDITHFIHEVNPIIFSVSNELAVTLVAYCLDGIQF